MREAPFRTVALLIGDIPVDAPIDEQDGLIQAAAIQTALTDLGYHSVQVPFTLDLMAAKHWPEPPAPPFVVNLVELVGGRGQLVHLAPALLDIWALPYTGCGTIAMWLTSDKTLAKRYLRADGLPTPDWLHGSALQGAEAFPGPWIVKSRYEHGSFGLDQTSVTHRWADLPGLIAERQRRYGGHWFIERYIDGREFNIALLGSRIQPLLLPAAEMHFTGWHPDQPRIVGYAAKWIEDSFEYLHTVRSFDHHPADVPLLQRLFTIGMACWKLFNLQGYARVDIRVDATEQFWIIDVNANPCIAPDSGFVSAAAQVGLHFSEMLQYLVRAAVAQHPAPLQIPLRNAAARYTQDDTDDRGVSSRLMWRSRPHPSDAAAVRRLVRSTGFFSEPEIALATELVEENLHKGDGSGYLFLFLEQSDRLVGYACFGPASGTDSSWHLYWIAVCIELQRRGLGGRILARSEALIVAGGGQRIYIETSSRHHYHSTRAFYEKHGYRKVAELEHFYTEGESKVIYMKIIKCAPGQLVGREGRRD